RFTEMGSPVYFAPAAGADACDPETVVAAALACCAACCAATLPSGRAGSRRSPYDANATEGWVSSLGNAKRGAETCTFLDFGETARGAVVANLKLAGEVCASDVSVLAPRFTGVAGCASKKTTSALPSRAI